MDNKKSTVTFSEPLAFDRSDSETHHIKPLSSAELGFGVTDEFERMSRMVIELELSEENKRFIMSRVIQELITHKDKSKCIDFAYRSLNTVQTLGTVAMPALLTLSAGDTAYYDVCFWLSFGISISTGIVAGLTSFFQVN